MKYNVSATRRYRLPTQVLVYCYRQFQGRIEYLLLRRTPKLGGFWQGVTGAPEGTESLLAAAKRELFEETQFLPSTIRRVDFDYLFLVNDDWKWAYHPDVTSIQEYIFLAAIPGNADPVLSFEHDSSTWVCFERALDLLRWPNNRKALEHCDQLAQASAVLGNALTD